jgi:hypothetical protein
MIILASVAVALRFETIDWVLGDSRSSETGGELSETKGRLLRMNGVEISKIDKEESSRSRDCLSGILRISFIIVTNKEETLLFASRNCTRSEEIVIS